MKEDRIGNKLINISIASKLAQLSPPPLGRDISGVEFLISAGLVLLLQFVAKKYILIRSIYNLCEIL